MGIIISIKTDVSLQMHRLLDSVAANVIGSKISKTMASQYCVLRSLDAAGRLPKPKPQISQLSLEERVLTSNSIEWWSM